MIAFNVSLSRFFTGEGRGDGQARTNSVLQTLSTLTPTLSRKWERGKRKAGVAGLLMAALSIGSAAKAEERYFAQTASNDEVPRDTHASAGGFLYASTGEWQFGISRLLATGPITEAYMTSRSRPIPGEVSVLPSLAPHDRGLSVHLSAVQVRQVVAGDWMLTVRSSGFTSGRFVGQADLRNEDDGIPGTDTTGRHTLKWVASNHDGPAEAGVAEQPFAAFIHFDRAAGTMCLRIDPSNDHTEREPVAAFFAASGSKAASTPVTFKRGPDDSYREACSRSATTLAAGVMQVTVTTAAAPAREFNGTFTVSRDDTPGPTGRFGSRLGRMLSPLPDLH